MKMTWRSKIWPVVGVLFIVINVAGAGFAVAAGELMHAGIHAVLVLPGAYLLWRLAPWQRREDDVTAQLHGGLDDRLANIEQSVDAVAIEVERIGEGQRFVTKLFAERDRANAPAGSANAPAGPAPSAVAPSTAPESAGPP